MKCKTQCRWQAGGGVGDRAAQPRAAAAHGGERALQSHTLVTFLQQGGGCAVSVCVEGRCNCRGIMCSQSFFRYWRSQCLCALFYICRSFFFFFFFATVLGFDQTENTGEKSWITARAFRASVSSSAPIVFHSHYCIFPTSSSQFFLVWQHLSWIILVEVLFFLEHRSKKGILWVTNTWFLFPISPPKPVCWLLTVLHCELS